VRLEDLPVFLSVAQFRRLFSPPIGRGAAYAFARKYGVRIGGRLFVPRSVVERLLGEKVA